ncbi:MAG: type II secretion system F family protein [Nitrospiria bacterium]
MTTFLYKATDAQGTVMEGTMDALKEGIVVNKLQALGYIPIRVAPAKSAQKPLAKKSLRFDLNSIGRREILTFTQEFSALLKAGLPIDRALQILIGMAEKEKNAAVLQGILNDVTEGIPLADALAKHPKLFSPLYISMVRSGESSGTLTLILERLSVFLERSEELRSYVLSAMIYPALLVTASGASILILLTFVIPKFASIFSGMGVALPFLTEQLLILSQVIRDHWQGGLLFLLVVSMALRYAIGRPQGARVWGGGVKLKLPLFGKLIQRIEMARFTQTLGTVLKGGVPILQALAIAKAVIRNNRIAEAIQETHGRVKRGERIGASLREKDFIPHMVCEMITVGEETGRLHEILLDVAEILDKQVREQVKRLLALIEPGLILIMGLIVGTIVISMLMAIFSVNEIPF